MHECGQRRLLPVQHRIRADTLAGLQWGGGGGVNKCGQRRLLPVQHRIRADTLAGLQ